MGIDANDLYIRLKSNREFIFNKRGSMVYLQKFFAFEQLHQIGQELYEEVSFSSIVAFSLISLYAFHEMATSTK